MVALPTTVWLVLAETVSAVTVAPQIRRNISPSAGAAGMVNVPVAKVPAGVSTSVEVAFAGVMVKPVVGVCTT